jgi:hypothetical protein
MDWVAISTKIGIGMGIVVTIVVAIVTIWKTVSQMNKAKADKADKAARLPEKPTSLLLLDDVSNILQKSLYNERSTTAIMLQSVVAEAFKNNRDILAGDLKALDSKAEISIKELSRVEQSMIGVIRDQVAPVVVILNHHHDKMNELVKALAAITVPMILMREAAQVAVVNAEKVAEKMMDRDYASDEERKREVAVLLDAIRQVLREARMPKLSPGDATL